jgi:hypothetical protein
MHIHYRVFAVGQRGLEHSVVPRRDRSVEVELPHVTLLVRGAHLLRQAQTAGREGLAGAINSRCKHKASGDQCMQKVCSCFRCTGLVVSAEGGY